MKRNTFSVLCYARKREQGKDKQYPIMVRITIDSEQVQFNSQLMVDKKMWKDGGVVGRSATAVYLRTQIEKIKTDITRIYEKEIENNRYPSPLKLKNIYLGIETKANTLLTVFKKMNEEKRKEVGTSLSQNTYKKYDLTYRRMEEYIQFRFRKEKYKDIPLTEINEEFINGFRNFLRVDKKVGHNATSKMMQLFKKAVTRARNAGLIQFNPFTQPITFVQVDKGFLTMDELQSIMDKEIEVERLQRVRDVFVFSCWTGLAYIDIYLLKDEHIQKYLDGNYWIISKRHKTGVPINVRLLDIPLRILQKYKGKQPDHRALPMPSNQKMNAYLKELADICGIRKNLTYHLARHTFATTVTLTNGVSIESVSKMLGHTNIRTTQIYAKVINQKSGSEMEALSDRLHVSMNAL